MAISSGADDLDAIDRRIARLEKAAGTRLSHLLADGLDPAVAAHAARGLNDQLAAAKAHRAQVVASEGANVEASRVVLGFLGGLAPWFGWPAGHAA